MSWSGHGQETWLTWGPFAGTDVTSKQRMGGLAIVWCQGASEGERDLPQAPCGLLIAVFGLQCSVNTVHHSQTIEQPVPSGQELTQAVPRTWGKKKKFGISTSHAAPKCHLFRANWLFFPDHFPLFMCELLYF